VLKAKAKQTKSRLIKKTKIDNTKKIKMWAI